MVIVGVLHSHPEAVSVMHRVTQTAVAAVRIMIVYVVSVRVLSAIYTAPSGCNCDAGCTVYNDCCGDYNSLCGKCSCIVSYIYCTLRL